MTQHKLFSIIIFSLFLFIFVPVLLGYWSDEEQAKKENPVQTGKYVLAGKGKQWEVSDYTIVKTKNEIVRGSAQLHYLGTIDNIKHSQYLLFRFIEHQPGIGETTVFSNSYKGEGSKIHILNKIENLGEIQSAPSDIERSMSKDDFEKTTLELEWKDSRGALHKETIDLSVQTFQRLDETR